MPGEDTEPDDISERVARGFEALVSEEAAVHRGPPPSAAGGPPLPAPAASSTSAEAPMSIAATRLVALESRVRQTMDRLTELVEAQLPETVDGLRADLETLRLELQTSLAQASELMAEERKQLRAQIATTVGAANRWFVRARDQINERLDRIAEAAAQAQEQAEVAAVAATAAVTVFTEPYAEEADGEPEAEPEDAEGGERDEGEGGIEWAIEEEVAGPRRRVRAVDVAVEASELEALLDPVRGDVQELQLEVSTMGEAVSLLADQVAKLATRLPARPKGVKLAPDQIELIVEAVMEGLAARSTPARKAAPAKKAARAKKKVEPPLKQAAAALAKKKAAGGG